jgi:hypothetical protein
LAAPSDAAHHRRNLEDEIDGATLAAGRRDDRRITETGEGPRRRHTTQARARRIR